MAKKDNQAMWIIIVIVVGIIFLKYSGFFGINVMSNQIQYYNQPIEVKFGISNFTNPEVQFFFNDKEVFTELTYNTTETIVNQTTNETLILNKTITRNQSIALTRTLINGTEYLKVTGLAEEGILKITATDVNHTESAVVEVRKPYVGVSNNLISSLEKGTTMVIEVTTTDPQGKALDADTVEIEVSLPNSQKETINLDKDGTTFKKSYYFGETGNYIFKIHAKKAGYDAKETTFITSVVKTEGVHPIVWVWTAAVVIWILLIIIKLLRRKKII